MKLVWTLLVAAGACRADGAGGRIVGGEPATILQYPGIVQLEFAYYGWWWFQSCAANILNSRYVVSAAHCFERVSPDIRRIRAGSTYREAGGDVVYINWYLNHPSYGTAGMGMDGDISIAQLSSPLSFGATIQAVGIPVQGFQLPDGLPVVHAGWGDTFFGSGTGSTVLRDVVIYSINRAVCRERYSNIYGRVISDNMICAGILDEGGKDACRSDSGGPLYYGDVLVGIISWGERCAEPRHPGVNTKVSSYTNWIVENAV